MKLSIQTLMLLFVPIAVVLAFGRAYWSVTAIDRELANHGCMVFHAYTAPQPLEYLVGYRMVAEIDEVALCVPSLGSAGIEYKNAMLSPELVDLINGLPGLRRVWINDPNLDLANIEEARSIFPGVDVVNRHSPGLNLPSFEQGSHFGLLQVCSLGSISFTLLFLSRKLLFSRQPNVENLE
ncbi:MAG: hypothetical protein KDA87_23750 [Planctomycetales bacterium]|nr:hypothetical protein [Planctomycetales bacterium]